MCGGGAWGGMEDLLEEEEGEGRAAGPQEWGRARHAESPVLMEAAPSPSSGWAPRGELHALRKASNSATSPGASGGSLRPVPGARGSTWPLALGGI